MRTMQIREQLEQLIDAAVSGRVRGRNAHARAGSRGGSRAPRDESNGDWASTVAMRSAKLAKKNPREIAQIIVDTCPRTT